jgi:hypothetical protein
VEARLKIGMLFMMIGTIEKKILSGNGVSEGSEIDNFFASYYIN